MLSVSKCIGGSALLLAGWLMIVAGPDAQAQQNGQNGGGKPVIGRNGRQGQALVGQNGEQGRQAIGQNGQGNLPQGLLRRIDGQVAGQNGGQGRQVTGQNV